MKHATDFENMLAADKEHKELLEKVQKALDTPIGQDEPDSPSIFLLVLGYVIAAVLITVGVIEFFG